MNLSEASEAVRPSRARVLQLSEASEAVRPSRARVFVRVLASAALATGLATCLANRPAWGHSFPAVRTVVVQVETCEVALLVGYRPGTGEETAAVLARASTRPKSQAAGALRDVLTTQALGPIKLQVDGVSLVPTSVRAKIGVEPGGARPMVVVLVTYALPAGRSLAVHSTDVRSTRISWVDRSSGRVEISHAPTQNHAYAGVASFLLSLAAGDSPCAPPSPHSGHSGHSGRSVPSSR